VQVAASTVWKILREAGVDPAPERASTTWAAFLRSQAEALLACDFFETVTLTGSRMYVLAAIEHASRRTVPVQPWRGTAETVPAHRGRQAVDALRRDDPGRPRCLSNLARRSRHG
jgi:hypothetical protein